MTDGRAGRLFLRDSLRTTVWISGARTIGAAIAALALLSGCWSFQESDYRDPRPTPPSAFEPSVWPPRDLEPIRELAEKTPEVIRWNRLIEGTSPTDLTDVERRVLETDGVRITYKGIHGLGLLRVVEPLDPSGDENDSLDRLEAVFNFMLTGFQPNAYWLTSKTLEGLRESRQRAEAFSESYVGSMPGLSIATTEPGPQARLIRDMSSDGLWLHSGMDIRLPDHRPESKPYRGLVLHLNAMFGNEYEVRTLDELRDRGWAVIDLKPTSQVTSPIPPEWVEMGTRAIVQRRELIARIFTEITGSPSYAATSLDDYHRVSAKYRQHALAPEVDRLERLINRCRAGAFIVRGPEDYEPVAAQVARQIDQAQAGSAYAAEAVLDYVDAHRPDLRDLPTVVMGFSAGGLASPTTVARIKDRVRAVVIIGGGADCFSASQLSTFSNGGLIVRTSLEDPLNDTKLTKAQIAEISKAYLRASKLDPYHTAPLLGTIPTLLVTGKADTWVPAACGNLLWDRLGKPDRLTIDAGHELLFYFLPSKAPFIAGWLEEAVAAPPDENAADPVSSVPRSSPQLMLAR